MPQRLNNAAKELFTSAVEFMKGTGFWFWLVVTIFLLGTIGVLQVVLKALKVDYELSQWVFVIGLVVSVVAASFQTFHKARLSRDLNAQRIQVLENAHPTVKVEPHIMDDWAMLKVTNLGPEEATFKADVVEVLNVLEAGQHASIIRALGWYSSEHQERNKEKELAKGQSGYVVLAKSGGSMGDTFEVGLRNAPGHTVRQAYAHPNTAIVFRVNVFSDPSLAVESSDEYLFRLERIGDKVEWKCP